ncbi:MAG TPA: methyltransferase [Micromonosporaceae bacterium]
MTALALLDDDNITRLREALSGVGYTPAGIATRLGPDAVAALARNDFRAALRATDGATDRLATLIRLFVCGQTEPEPAVARALQPLPFTKALDAGLVERIGGGARAALELEPYGDWWVVSDLSAATRPGPLPADHVLGVGGASTTLAGATIRRPVGSALDLGTGCGVQALHLSTHAGAVTATDLSERALRFAATTAALNGLSWELLRGDLVEPVAGRRFDLVVSNPPFVVGPGTATHTYRDSGRAGDQVCAELARAAAGLLNPGGTLQFLANWAHVAGEDWRERVAGWFAGTGLDVWAVQREVSDPMGYVNLWLADASERHDPRRAETWLDWFDEQRIEAVGFGIVTARLGGHDDPVVRVEDLRQPLDRPLGPTISAWFDRQDWLRTHRDLLGERFRAVEGLGLRQEASLGADGWAVDRQILVLPDGPRWTQEIDPVVLALVSGCDGGTPLAEQVAVLAAAHDVTEDVLAEVLVPIVAHLVERGFLEPVTGEGRAAA